MTSIESAESLDRLSAKIRPVAERLVGTGVRRDLLTGRWLGHAVHPAIVLAPMGCWMGAAVADVVGGSAGAPVARRLVGAGLLTVGPAVASGTADWLDTSDAEQRVGTAHLLMNDAATLAMVGSWIVRGRGHRVAGMALSFAGVGALMAAGMLGGHLAYARGVGTSTTAFQAGPDEWTRLAASDEIGDEPTEVDLDGVGYMAVRHDGAPRVLENRCTHRGAPLSDGAMVETNGAACIECPWHGSRFDVRDGAVVAGPASVPQPAYETRMIDGSVEIRRTELGGLRRNSTHPSAR